MAENREYLTHAEEGGSINISEDVVIAIATEAINEVEGASAMMNGSVTEQFIGKKPSRNMHMAVENGEIVLDVYLMVRYGYAVPEIAAKVQEGVAGAVASMAGFPVKAVNVHVGGISFN